MARHDIGGMFGSVIEGSANLFNGRWKEVRSILLVVNRFLLDFNGYLVDFCFCLEHKENGVEVACLFKAGPQVCVFRFNWGGAIVTGVGT